MDEGYEALTLMQTGKSQLMPLVLIDRPGGTYWKTWDKHVREHLLRDQLISPDDLNLYQITDDTDQAVKMITRFYRNFHSSRFVKELFVIRLKHAPPASALQALNEDFADLIIGQPGNDIAGAQALSHARRQSNKHRINGARPERILDRLHIID